LPFYAILRAFDFNIGPIDSKLAGVIAMFASIAVLFVLPWIDTSRVRSMRYRPVARQFFLIFVVACLVLGWCGGQNPGRILSPATFSATLNWVEGGTLGARTLHAPSAGDYAETETQARAELTEAGAAMVMVQRQNATDASITTVTGGAPNTRTVTAGTLDELETEIAALKTEVGQRAPFFSVTRNVPWTFTVTTLSQIATFYYFFFFLIILPLLGLRERPGRVPDTIAKPVLAEQGAA
jgi:ubiquinol-cytochrome c reductase cytochrome b subunit